MNTELTARYIDAKYHGATREALTALRKDVAVEIESIKAAKSDVFARYPGVHGRFQQSQLDVLDIREMKACALFDNVTAMIAAAR